MHLKITNYAMFYAVLCIAIMYITHTYTLAHYIN